jgi:DNA invertase Pin-like site-specific DNA recombinase
MGDHAKALRKAHADLVKARASLNSATQNACIAAVEANADGTPEIEIARTLGVNRMTVRRWLGKL